MGNSGVFCAWGEHRPSKKAWLSPATRCRSSLTSRLFPIPGSPVIKLHCPAPPATRRHRSSKSSSS